MRSRWQGLIGALAVLVLHGANPRAIAEQAESSYYVSASGSDRTGDGSRARPWATLLHAARALPDDGSELVFLDGAYGPQSLDRSFTKPVVIRAQHPYRARWLSTPSQHRLLAIERGRRVTISGFEMAGRPGGKGEYLIHLTTPETSQILLHNNIIHDGYDNDLIKVNAGCHHIRFLGNLLYNQPRGGDEHMDINSVHDVMVEDNVFFNDFAASHRRVLNNTHPYVLIKNSGTLPQTRNFLVRGNVFLNWQGLSDQPYLLLGEDAKPYHEAENVLVENNLFLGNSSNPMTAAFCVKGVRNVVFRANTVHGDFPLGSGSWGFAMRLGREGSNPPNERIRFVNNIWSDPTGTMTHFASGSPENSAGVSLRNCLYYNGGRPIPVDKDRVLNVTDDPRALIKDPGLPSNLEKVVAPSWNSTTHRFADGSSTIEEVRKKLIESFGTPSEKSPAVDSADPTSMPREDILHRPRGPKPDIGAVEIRP